MSKACLIFDDFPDKCIDCPLKRNREDLPLGNFTYQRLYRCMFEPEELSEDDGDIVYLNDIMMDCKPSWCPLKKVKEE